MEKSLAFNVLAEKRQTSRTLQKLPSGSRNRGRVSKDFWMTEVGTQATNLPNCDRRSPSWEARHGTAASHGTWTFITMFTRTCQRSLSYATWVQSTPSYPVSATATWVWICELFSFQAATSHLQRIVHTEFVGKLCLWSVSITRNYHITSSNGSSVLAMEPRANEGFRAVVMFLYTLKNVIKSCLFLIPIIVYYFRTLYQMALVSLPLQTFVRPSCCTKSRKLKSRPWGLHRHEFQTSSHENSELLHL
jgi:hypothetical protein